MAYKPKSWPHGVIAAIAMVVFVLLPDMGHNFYAGALPVMYYYGREVRDAENTMGVTTFNYLQPLVPWFWKNRDNRMDFYYPVFAVGIVSFILIFF